MKINKKEISELNYTSKINFIQQDKYIEELVNDENAYIRMLIAKRGHKLDKLIYDENQFVKNETIKYCKERSEKPECRKILQLYNL